MPHARGIFVAHPALLGRRRRKFLHELQAVAQAHLAQDDLVVGIDFLDAGHGSLMRRCFWKKGFVFCEFSANGLGVGAQHRHLQPFADIAAVPLHRQRRNAERRAIGVEILHQPAGAQHMRVLQQVLGTVDRRVGDVQHIEPCREIGDLPALDHFGDARNDPPARQYPVRGVAQGRIVSKFLKAELAAKAPPVPFGDDADEDALAVRSIEDVVDRPGVLALRHRARLPAGHLILDHVLGNQKQAVLEQPDADIGAVPLAAPLLVERGEDRDRAEHAAHDVIGGGADALRLVARPGHGGEARHHLHDLVERRAMLVRTGQKALVTGDDQMRVFAAQLLRSEPLLLQLAVAKIFHEHVGAFEQPVHGLAVFGIGEIEHDAALAPVEQRKERGSHAAERAGLVAHRWLDLDDLGAQLREDHAAGRAHHHMGHLDDPHAVKRQSRSGHRMSPVASVLGPQPRPSAALGKAQSVRRCIRCRMTPTARAVRRLGQNRPLAETARVYLPLARVFTRG